MLKIKELRLEKGIEQQELAKIIQIGKGSISNWELGRTEPSIEYIVKLADYFEVSTDYLLGRSNDVGVIETNANLTPFQNNLLAVVSALPRDDQFQVLGFAQALAR
ncbi:MAG: helix-turn-helix domain-containing protein [Corallococcus sp.]|nr:helix-turn-helix domain-containing protein [Bacillota bacterium]MCM1534231.1 helix-turn-helix domain-containing protein [Corallococcus sp.]